MAISSGPTGSRPASTCGSSAPRRGSMPATKSPSSRPSTRAGVNVYSVTSVMSGSDLQEPTQGCRHLLRLRCISICVEVLAVLRRLGDQTPHAHGERDRAGELRPPSPPRRRASTRWSPSRRSCRRTGCRWPSPRCGIAPPRRRPIDGVPSSGSERSDSCHQDHPADETDGEHERTETRHEDVDGEARAGLDPADEPEREDAGRGRRRADRQRCGDDHDGAGACGRLAHDVSVGRAQRREDRASPRSPAACDARAADRGRRWSPRR